MAKPVAFSVPVEYTALPATIKTLGNPAEEITTLPFACGMFTLLEPLAIPLTPAVEKS